MDKNQQQPHQQQQQQQDHIQVQYDEMQLYDYESEQKTAINVIVEYLKSTDNVLWVNMTFVINECKLKASK